MTHPGQNLVCFDPNQWLGLQTKAERNFSRLPKSLGGVGALSVSALIHLPVCSGEPSLSGAFLQTSDAGKEMKSVVDYVMY